MVSGKCGALVPLFMSDGRVVCGAVENLRIWRSVFAMDAKTILTTASVMVLANGAILAIIGRELPVSLRSSASYWCFGTLLVALGCVVFAFGGPLPRPVVLAFANAGFAFGLTAYYVSIRQFLGLKVAPWHFAPAVVTTGAVIWFSTVDPNFHVRMAVVTVAWICMMLMCLRDLLDKSRGHASLARSILAAMFIGIVLYSAARGVFYLSRNLPEDFAVEAGGNWLNVFSALFLTMLPVMGTTAFLLMCSDRLRRGLERAASTDYLTGLPNRRSLAENAIDAFHEARAKGGDFAVAVFDVDKFKVINDSHGHDVGDRALVHVANRLRGELRPTDMIARTGGEEFVVLFRDLAKADVLSIAERMRMAIGNSDFSVNGRRIELTISAGLAFAEAEDAVYDDVLRRADNALYRAKANGRDRLETASVHAPDGRIVVAPPAMSSEGWPSPSAGPQIGSASAQISR